MASISLIPSASFTYSGKGSREREGAVARATAPYYVKKKNKVLK